MIAIQSSKASSAKVGELLPFDDKDPKAGLFYLRYYLLQEPLYETVLDMQRPPDEDQDQYDERIRQYGKVNGKLLSIIMGAVSKNKVARDVMLNYEGEKWAFDLVEYLIRRFSPKENERFGQLLVKFGQLKMLYEEGPQEFTDRVLACEIEIKAVDSS